MVGILEKWNGGTREEGHGRCQATVIRNDGIMEGWKNGMMDKKQLRVAG